MRLRRTCSSFFGKNADDAVNRFGRVNRVQRREHEVACLRSFERDFNGFAVAHLADEDYFRSLAQGGTQGTREIRVIE